MTDHLDLKLSALPEISSISLVDDVYITSGGVSFRAGGVGKLRTVLNGAAPLESLITDGIFHIASDSAGVVTAHANADELVVEGASESGITIIGVTQAGIFFADTNSQINGFIQQQLGTKNLLLGTDGLERLQITTTEIIINALGLPGGDFRHVGDTSSHLLFCDASANRVGISFSGNLTTDGLFHVAGGSAGTITSRVEALVVIEDDVDTGLQLLSPVVNKTSIFFGNQNDNDLFTIEVNHNSGKLTIFNSGTNLDIMNMISNAGTIFNDGGSAALNFRVESNLNTHMLFVDSGNNSIHIDNSLLTGAGDGSLVMANNKRIQWINNAGTTSLRLGIDADSGDNINLRVPADSGDFTFNWTTTTRGSLILQNSGMGILFQGESSADHNAPVATNCVLYTKDVGGKTAIFARFNTGAVQQIAIEP